MSTFGDAIANTVSLAMQKDSRRWEQELAVTSAMLAMPEMQAIRAALRSLTAEHGFGADLRQRLILERHVPASVIEWVMGA